MGWLTHAFFIILFMCDDIQGSELIAYILKVTTFGYKSLKSHVLA